MKMKLGLILVAVALAAVATAQQPVRLATSDESRYGGATNPLGLEVPPYRVALMHEAQVPGQEPGVLVELNVVEGQQVKAGDLLGKIDAEQPRMQGLIAWEEHKAALEKAANDVDVRYAEKATQLAYTEWQKSVEANKTRRGAISDIEVKRQWLTYERGGLEKERAQSERKIAGFTAAAKAVEIEAAQEAMKRREIRSPVDGVVVQVHLHKGEWVKPGDPVLHVVQLDRLKVEGEVQIKDFSPGQIIDRPVTIEATLQGRKVQFDGRITFVRPLLNELGEKYLVKAEVDNRKEDGQWLLLPNLYVDMKIHAREPRLTKAE